MKSRTDARWPVTWSEVDDEQLREWLRATPAQRLAWLEEMLEFARTVGRCRMLIERETYGARHRSVNTAGQA